MGLSYHRSIKLGKNTHINLSKHGGIGISTGVKGARISVNKQGVRTSVGKDGLYYRKQANWNTLDGNTKQIPLTDDEIKSETTTLKEYNLQAFSNVEKKVVKWYAIIAIADLILGAFIGDVGFWIIFVLDCIGFIGLTASGIRYLIQHNKQGRMLYKDK
jgi:hypothetical protein